MREKPSFICDSMLGRLSRWLRVLGYDTVFQRDSSDYDILSLLKSEGNRILLTRDRQLYTRASCHGAECILIPYENIIEQLSYIGKKLGLSLKVNPDNSRCSMCNNPLVKVSNINSIRGLIPPLLRLSGRRFWYCVKCNKVFWKGRMWPNISRIASAASKAMRRVNR